MRARSPSLIVSLPLVAPSRTRLSHPLSLGRLQHPLFSRPRVSGSSSLSPLPRSASNPPLPSASCLRPAADSSTRLSLYAPLGSLGSARLRSAPLCSALLRCARLLQVGLSEADCSARFGDKLDKFESGDMPSVVAKVLSAFTKRKVQGIKSGGFNASSADDRAKSIRCSLKAAEGFLFPLDKGFYFLSNKPVLAELDRVSSVEFNRVDKASSAAGRTFDITVHMKDMSTDLQFVNLQRSDYKELFRFLSAKKVRIKNIAAAGYGEGGGGGGGSDSDDPGLERARREGAANAAAAMDDDDDDDDSDDEDDEDFVGGGESSVDEEYDDADSDDSEAAGGKKKSKGKKSKDKGGSSKDAPPKKRKAEGSDDDSDDESGSDAPPPKKKAAKKDSDGSDESDSESDKPLKKKAPKKAKSPLENKPKRKVKAKKDKEAPKRGQSAYFLWMNAVGRGKAKEEEPGIDIKEVSRRCGAMWKEMGADDKAEWEGKAKEDKARYDREIVDYRAKQKAEAAAADSDSDDDEPAAKKEAPSGSDSDS